MDVGHCIGDRRECTFWTDDISVTLCQLATYIRMHNTTTHGPLFFLDVHRYLELHHPKLLLKEVTLHAEVAEVDVVDMAEAVVVEAPLEARTGIAQIVEMSILPNDLNASDAVNLNLLMPPLLFLLVHLMLLPDLLREHLRKAIGRVVIVAT